MEFWENPSDDPARRERPREARRNFIVVVVVVVLG